MKNEVIHISAEEMEKIKMGFKLNQDIFLVELDGRNIKNLSEYFEKISKLCNFPMAVRTWPGYEDWMCDFSWIDKDSIVFIINYYKEFMQFDLLSKKIFIEDFEDCILPFWEEEVVECVVEGERKSFMVYLAD